MSDNHNGGAGGARGPDPRRDRRPAWRDATPTEVIPVVGVDETAYIPAMDETQLIPIPTDIEMGLDPSETIAVGAGSGPPGPPGPPRQDDRSGADPGGGIGADAARGEPGIGRSSRIMAVASATSRVTGFVRQAVITAALGSLALGNAYNTANYLPNQVYELLIGGVLTSVVVPLLVRAERDGHEAGTAYAQRLLSLTTVLLGAATVVAIVFAAPIIALNGIHTGTDQGSVAVLLARILLVEILFYGIAALLSAILNTRGVFGAPAWAPVLNNFVVIITAAVFIAMPGPASLNPSTITTAQTLVLGIGTTLGVIAQALILIPAIRKTGFRWRWRFDVRGVGLREAGRLSLWVVGYAVISQVSYTVVIHIANNAPHKDSAALGSLAYSNASLLFVTPYGIVGVALLTALLPRMSRAAAAGDLGSVVDDLSLGSRLTAVALVPITAAYIALGPALTDVVFAHGETTLREAHSTGIALSWAAFGLLPYAVTLLQLRAFYAIKDARTPTLINVVMVVCRVGMALLVPVFLSPQHVVAGLTFVNSASFIPGMVMGEVLLRRRFGPLHTRRVAQTVVRLGIASAVGGVLAWLALDQIYAGMGHHLRSSLLGLVCGSIIGGVVALVIAWRLRVPEVAWALAAVSGRLSRSR